MFDNTHFPRAVKFWHNGDFHDWEKPTVHTMSHALHYGNSVFEGIRAYDTEKGPAIFRLDIHLHRLFQSASVLDMKVPSSKEDITNIIKSLIKENNLKAAYIRPLLFYSYGNLGLVPKFSPVELVIGAWEWGAYLGEKSDLGVTAYLLPWKRIHHSQFDMSAKLGGIYVLSTIGGNLARSKGFDEAIFLNMEGNISEGPGENICIIKNNVLRTNDKSESILEGITRTTLLGIAQDLGIKTEIAPITKEDLFQADEVFFCGTAVEVAPVIRIRDGSVPIEKDYIIGTGERGEITTKLAETYKNAVRGKIKDYHSWLTFVEA
jgi:branched-chain amino acid aminotransferase